MSEQTVETGTESPKTGRKVAEHSYLDAAGNVVETEEEATGIRYHIVSTGETFDHQTGGKAGEPITMKAVFGCKTLATNEASAFKQKNGHYDGAVESIAERFNMIDSGQFVDRSREGVGAKIDLDKLCEATCRIMVRDGAWTQEQVDTEKKAKLRGQLEDKAVVARVRKTDGVMDEYQRLVGKPIATAADLAAALG